MIRVGAIADLHSRAANETALNALLTRCKAEADLLIIAGDLTDTGLEEEARILGEMLAQLDIPIVAVLGNHDFHHNQQLAIQRTLERHGVVILDGDGWKFERDGIQIGIAGCVGFGGGFRPYNLTAFGEPAWKSLYEKTLEETRKLDRGLSGVKGADYVIAVTHYGVCLDTMGEEPEALHPFLGSSELGDALERHNVTFGVHGHAHRGARDGCTANGIPVFNVALPIVDCPLVWRLGAEHDAPIAPLATTTGRE